MKRNPVGLILILLLIPLTVNAGLDKLIQQNVRDADKSYEQIISTVDQPIATSQLWIHLRSDSQRNLAEKIYKYLSDAKLQGIRVARKPLQLVDSGPLVSQLRYFRKEDGLAAQELFKALRTLVPDLVLKDFSGQYLRASWIKRGHYELWLSVEAGKTGPGR